MGSAPRGRWRRWWRRSRQAASRQWNTTCAHAEAEWRLLPNRYRPWHRCVVDGVVVAERRRPDGTIAARLPWSEYCALRARHRKLATATRDAVRQNRWRWLLRACFGWLA
jgi:hypothetical protein